MQPPPVPVPPPVTVTVPVPIPAFPPQPIVVDTVTSGWDKLGAIGDFTGGVFAGGALLIAALVYRAQVHDARRMQASKVRMKLQPPPIKGRLAASIREQVGGFYDLATITNTSKNDIIDLIFFCTGRELGSSRSMETTMEFTPVLGPDAQVAYDLSGKQIYDVKIGFSDDDGRNWSVDMLGNLKENRSPGIHFDDLDMLDGSGTTSVRRRLYLIVRHKTRGLRSRR
jgi:hypothetical protein